MSNYTPSSGAYFNDDGSCGIGVECFFQPVAGAASKATQSWTLSAPVYAVEFWGNISMRTSGAQADVLIGVFLDSREIWGAILKANNGTVNLPAHAPAMLINKTSANPILRVDMEAAGSGDAWNPLNCEIRLCGRWQMTPNG